MKIRKNLSLIEVTSIAMLDSSYEENANYLVMETQTHMPNGMTLTELMMTDYDLPHEECMSILNNIHRYFDRYPSGIFDFRKYESAEKYKESTGKRVIYRDLQ